MRLSDKWYQKYKKDKARHKAAYGRNILYKKLQKLSSIFFYVVLSFITLAIYFIIANT